MFDIFHFFLKMTSFIINQICDEFREQPNPVTIDQVKTFCDNILVQINQNKDRNNINVLNTVVNALQSIKKEQLNDSRILDHALFVVLRDTLVSLLIPIEIMRQCIN